MVDAPKQQRMPPVWRGRRRWLLVALGALGVLQAALALLMALAVDLLLSQAGDRWDLVALVGAVLGIGVGRWIERVVAEDLGQDYVFEQRHRLITSALGRPAGSLGVTVTRASNDLTAVRNWVALGIVPLVTSVPLIIVVLAGLAVLDWLTAIAVAIPLVVVAAVIPALAAVTLRRSRELRRRRGRMSARIADSVQASESVRVSGAVHRELKATDRDSRRVVSAAVDRAWVTGLTRSLTMTSASLGTVAVVLLAVFGLTDPAGVAATMTLLGVIATPVSDLGRVVEYRQNYRAAARILTPLLAQADELRAREKQRRKQPAETTDRDGAVHIRGLVAGGYAVPDITARPGERVVLQASDPSRYREVIRELLGTDQEGVLTIDGRDVARASDKVRRTLVGLVSEHLPLERGSISRLVSYRVPEADNLSIRRVIERVGLRQRVRDSEQGLALKLKNGGQPWSGGDVMRLQLARAILGEPPLLVVEGADNLLGAAGRETLAGLIRDYPGVVLIVSQRAAELAGEHLVWEIEGRTRVGVSEVVQADDEDE